VDQDAGPSLFDRDLDPPYRRAVLLSDEVGRYQRVIVNPFLGVIGWLAELFLLGEVMSSKRLEPFFLVLSSLLLPLFLIQFHCLDCGATGWLHRVGRHVCPGVLARRERRTAWPRILAPTVQFRIWFGFLVLAAVVYVILIRVPG
jgi:hypothetical protein